ncbi:outer membrane protein [Bartonella sp. B35(2025)]
MSKKCLMATALVALISISTVQAVNAGISRGVAASVVAVPEFSWSGFYFGGQVGNFASGIEIRNFNKKIEVVSKDKAPHPSGFVGGIYAGSNIDLGDNFILGVETDVVLAGREDSKMIYLENLTNESANELNKQLIEAGVQLSVLDKFVSNDTGSASFTYKEKWSGATRVRVGFTVADYIMPYVVGGVAYTHIEGFSTISGTYYNPPNKKISAKVDYGTMTVIGYTVGGGVDFAMTDNVILRAEYRYSDFGKKKFKKDQAEFKYETNNFRVGVAYKF